MKDNKNTKKDKKVLLLLILFLFAVIALGGYGAYSYFYTQGDFSATSDSVSIASFDPRTNINSGEFLGDGGTITIDCPNSSTGHGTVTCTGSISVTNEGGTDITVEVSNASSGTYNTTNMTASPSTPEFDWTTKTIEPNQSETLYIEVPVYIDSYFGDNEDHYRDTEYENESSVKITVSFKLKATQVHN